MLQPNSEIKTEELSDFRKRAIKYTRRFEAGSIGAFVGWGLTESHKAADVGAAEVVISLGLMAFILCRIVENGLFYIRKFTDHV